MKRLDKRQTLRLLKAAVRKRGADEQVPDEGCVYTMHNAPSCIVGEVLFLASGKPFPEANFHNNSGIGGAGTLKEIEETLGLTFTPKAVSLLESAQYWQDMAMPWGEVLVKAQIEDEIEAY